MLGWKEDAYIMGKVAMNKGKSEQEIICGNTDRVQDFKRVHKTAMFLRAHRIEP
jgi:hypothetical protein